MKVTKDSVKKAAKAGAIAVAGAGAVYATSLGWPILEGNEVWLHMPCVQFEVSEQKNGKTKKKEKVKTCTKQGPLKIYRRGNGPKIEMGDWGVGVRD